MTPLAILQDIMAIAQMIYAQVKLAENNKAKLATLKETMESIIASIKDLDALVNNENFIENLTKFQLELYKVHTLVEKITGMGIVVRFLFARSHEEQLDDCKKKLIEYIPLLTLGLTAQQLINRDRDRQDVIADREALLQEKERMMREELENSKIKQCEREAILLKQLASMRHRLDQLDQQASIEVLSDEWIVYLDDIVFERKIEDGEFGSIYQGIWRDQPVTIKCFDYLATQSEYDQLICEARVMSGLRHETLAGFYGACIDSARPCLLTSVFEQGNLETALSSLSLSIRLEMAKELARGLAYLHAQQVIHGDVRPENIGITRDNHAKWMDVGLAKVRAAAITTLPRVSLGIGWQAPESSQNPAELTMASDVYSFGVLLWTLITGQLSYVQKTIPKDVPQSCRALIEACWSSEPATRPTALEVVRTLGAVLSDFSSASPAEDYDDCGVPLKQDGHPDFRPASPTGEEYYNRGVTADRDGNLNVARQNYERAYEKKYFKAYTRMGLFALKGLGGVSIDPQKAEDDFRYAAGYGHADGMFNLGRMLEKGHTVACVPDINQAIFWYKETLAVDSTYPNCQEKINLLTAKQNANNEAKTEWVLSGW